jgi:hypothetical protein
LAEGTGFELSVPSFACAFAPFRRLRVVVR